MNNIKKLRENKKLTLVELSKKVQIPNNTLSQYENEKRKPKLETWQALANFFNVSVEYLQGAYSKEEIAKIVQDCYKRGINNGNPKTVPFLVLTNLFNDTIDNYFISLGLIPYSIKDTDNLLKPDQINNLNFWLENLKPLYNNVAMKWLITKPNLDASNEEVLSAVNGAMSEFINASSTAYTSLNAYNYDYEIEQVVKNHYMQKRFKFLEEHEYWDHEEIDEGRWEEFPVYDFKHPHPLDGKKYYIENGKHFYFDENDKRHYID
ncbi:helix-turn-helix domain-containing protein [Lactobacillus johnsonii]|uniref:helix-turn-helix domain-containing protein n=1 Tax=Lactobacillus johnsonii TaxID=33959 RepID=UPI00254D84A6|nr:helix-turn-helix transcriptional regulator [Lactobacillus johnsonii]